MAKYYATFVLPDVAATHRDFMLLLRELDRARRAGVPATATEARVRQIYAGFQDALNDLGRRHATEASVRIRKNLDTRMIRRPGNMRPRLRHSIRSRGVPPIAGFATGAVQIADEDRMTSASPDKYPYWTLIEGGTFNNPFGYGGQYTGRVIRGFFAGPGRGRPWQRPLSGLSLAERAQFPTFVGLAKGPEGEIKRHIKPMWFLRDAVEEQHALWLADIRRVQDRTRTQLRSVFTPSSRRRPRGRRP